MMERFYPTSIGREYAAQTAMGKVLKFTKGKFGDGVRTNQNISAMTDLINPLGELPISKIAVKDSTVMVTTQFSNMVDGSLLSTFCLSEAGLFGKLINADGTDIPEYPETLLGYVFDNPGDSIPGDILTEFILNFPLTVSDTENINIEISSIAYTTQKDFDAEVSARTTADKDLDNSKVNIDGGDVSATVVEFTETEERENISTSETLATIFGKIKKWFADLKAVAFSGSYNDLTGTPTNATALVDGLMSSTDKAKLDGIAAGAQKNTVTGIKGDSETAYRTGNVNITKSNIGLGNVPNVTTNSQTPTFTQASSRTNIMSGETLSTIFGKIMKWFADLKNIAFTGSYSDLSDTPITPVYATCPTAASTTAKVATTTEDFTLTAGATVYVSFSYSNSASAPTLNVNDTGAIAIKQYGTTAPQTYSWYAGSVVEFIYNGTYWIMTGKEAATTTYAGIVKLSDSTSASALSSSDVNTPTVRDIYYGLPNINGSHTYNSGTNIYAPTSAGTAGYELVSSGSGAPVWKAPSYAVCSTAASTAAKTAIISNFKLVTGARAYIKFTYEHTSSTEATLNVNSTGAMPIVVHCGTDNLYVQNYFSWLAGETVEFLYDGTNWVAISSDMRFITGAQSATVVIGTTKTQGYCDFRCDGTNDTEMFQSAINRLQTYMSKNPPSENLISWAQGGKILIKEGSYHITSTLTLIKGNISGCWVTFEGEGKFGTVIETDGLQTFMTTFGSVTFKSMSFLCYNIISGNFFDDGYNLSFDDCHLRIYNSSDSSTSVGCFADLDWSGETGSSKIDNDGAFIMNNSEMYMYTKGTPNCYSGIKCNIVQIDSSRVYLENGSSDSNTELNLIYTSERGGIISDSTISANGRTSIVNSEKVNMTGNTITLLTSTAKISHYDTSLTSMGGSFVGNTVYCAYYVYMRFATISGNKFLKLIANKSTNATCYLYNQCPATIVGNFFDGGTTSSGTHGSWYINTSSTVICKDNISIGTLNKATNVPTTSLFGDNLNVG